MMRSTLEVLLLVVALQSCIVFGVADDSPYHCVMHAVDPDQYTSLPVVFNRTAYSPPYPLLTDCFEFVERSCCNAYSTEQLSENFQTATLLFFKCPACLSNLKRMWCKYACDPEQSEWLNVTKTGPVFGTDWREVRETVFKVANAVFDACRDVTLPSGDKVTVAFGATPADFLAIMGSKKYAPYPIVFNITEEGSMDMTEEELTSCSHNCGCQDCSPVCGDPPVGEDEDVCMFHSLTCLQASMLAVFVVTLMVIVYAYTWIADRSRPAMPEYQPILSTAPRVVPEHEDKHTDDVVVTGKGIRNLFYRLGLSVGKNPWGYILTSLFIVIMLSHGILKMEVQNDPERLWVPPGSRSQLEEAKFNDAFGKFWRIEQMIFTAKPGRKDGPVIITQADMQELYTIQHTIMNMTIEHEYRHYGIGDLCYKPMKNKGCNVESPMQYFQDSYDKIFNVPADDVPAHITYCTSSASLDADCISELGIPVFPNVIFGGYGGKEHKMYNRSEAAIITMMLLSDPDLADPSAKWEKVLLDYLNNFKSERLSVAYMTDRSVKDEVAREGTANAPTVIVSYIVMFMYVGFAFGRWPRHGCKIWQFSVLSKFGLSFCGIMVVAGSVAATCGIMAIIGVQVTLIIFEVIPFLVLAIGVDNLFIMINRFERYDTSLDVEHRLAMTFANIGPSITLAALSEAFAFGLGYLTKMPAIQAFALYAAMAIFLDYLLQITAFAGCLVLDARRVEHNKMDVFTCIMCHPEAGPVIPGERMLRKFMRSIYTPIILHPVMKTIIIVLFAALTLTCVTLTAKVSKGLNQSVALPQDSYLQNYFDNEEKYLEQGPPVFFVVKDLDVTNHLNQDKLCGMGQPCHNTSLINYVMWLAMNPELTSIAEPAVSWIDDYMSWLWSSQCCQWPPGCDPNNEECSQCISDGKHNNNVQPFEQWRPPTDKFMKFLPYFMNSTCIDANDASSGGCGVCGLPYVGGVVADGDNKAVTVSRFMSYHTPLNTQDDFISALERSYQHVDHLKKNQGIDVFTYSVFYVFFEQYLYIVSLAVFTLILSLLAVFLVTILLLGDMVGSLLIVLMVTLIQVDMLGFMYLWDIQLNAISVTNLVMCMGISIEFCVHVTSAFLANHGSRQDRVRKAMIDVGSSVVGGITLTKLTGVGVLAFAKSAVFTVYYFRMYLLIVCFGALHGLMLLPIILSLIGPKTRNTRVDDSVGSVNTEIAQ